MARIKEIERENEPNTMRFILDRPLTRGERYTYKTPEEAVDNEVAAALLSVHHVRRVEVADHSVRVSQDGDGNWSTLLGQLAPLVRQVRPVTSNPGVEADSAESSGSAPAIDRRTIARELRSVIDPELGINIVDLGLVYNITQVDGKVTVEFTATTPGCPMRRYLQQHINGVLESIEGITNYEAKLVWEPTWSVDMMDPSVELFSSPRPKQWIL